MSLMSVIARPRRVLLAGATLLAACGGLSSARAAPNLNDLKVRMHEACDRWRIYKEMQASSADGMQFWRQQGRFEYADAAIDRSSPEWQARQNYYRRARDFDAASIAMAQARTECLERKHAFLQALFDQMVEAWLTEPPPQTTRTTRRPPGTTRRPPSRTTVVRPPPRQQYDPQAAAAATGALIGIIGGVIAGSGAGHHHHHHGPTVRGGGPGRPAGAWGGRRPIP